ncbi:hypothetical protein NQ314_014375 [Rhamnusium bicolor]|uniref:Myb-like domain-containing protein n=1 Tax=Rhamnusium bicolor TaxID=1586634 RepID=A0AAV8X2C9_9CUCU|nr:hypothetical protein NQ314_014375 [Rhamnusium bicolor]
MEPLEIFDSINNKHINIYVTSEVAEKCRTDNAFAQDLFNKLQDQNIEDGSAVEIETIKTEAVDDLIYEEKIDKETWSRRDTLKLIKVYQRNKGKFEEYKQRKVVWTMIANELAQLNVYKSADKCAEKWKNLLRTYKNANEKPSVPTRFQYYQEMRDIFSNTQVTVSDSDLDDMEIEYKSTVPVNPLSIDSKEEPIEKESWSRYETLKLLKAYQKHRDVKKNFVKEKQFWAVISGELAKDNIQKPLDKCATKWKNLFRSYKKNVEKPSLPSRFQYFQEVSDVINNVELFVPDNLMDVSDDVDFDKVLDPDQFKCFLDETDCENNPRDICSWTGDETLKLIMAYKKHKHRFKTCPTKKYVWTIIAAELTQQGILRDSGKCENKWKSLMRSYRKSIKTGETPRFYFFDKMSEVLNDEGNSVTSDEVITTQKDISLVYDNMDSLNNADSLDNTDILENEDKGDTENIKYEEIIIETEPVKQDETDDNRYWSFNESSALLKAYASHRNKFKEVKRKMQIWEEISQELESLNIYKSPESCENKWKGMFNVYKTHKLNKTGPGKFSFYKEIDDMLKEKTIVDDVDDNVVHNKKCKCMEKRMLEKQKKTY